MKKLYYVYNKSRQKEHDLMKFLINKFSDIEHINSSFDLRSMIKTELVEIEPIIEFLTEDTFLPKKRKNDCILYLETLNLTEIRPFKSINSISVDFTLELNEGTTFIEFHEKQHKSLSVGRLEKIYDTQNNEYFVPRFLVRFLRDIWRWQNLDNFKIIWYDWFICNHLNVNELTSHGKYEFCLPQSFTFKNFGI